MARGCLWWLASAAAVIPGCGRLRFDPLSDAKPVDVVVVEKRFPAFGRNWNERVARDVSGKGIDAPCDVESYDGFYDRCIHGGEQLVVRVADAGTCDGVEAADALGAFVWECTSDGTMLTFATRGLAPDAGLATLLEPGGWKLESFHAFRDGVLRWQSPDAIWWDNPVVPLPDNGMTPAIALRDAGTVYTLAASRASNGYNIDADRIALVTLGDAVLSYGGGAAFNCSSETTADGAELANPTRRCLIGLGRQHDTWIEGRFDGGSSATRSERGIFTFLSAFTVLRHVEVWGHSDDGIFDYEGRASQLEHIVAVSNGGDGIHQLYSRATTLGDLVAANNGARGVVVYDGGPWRVAGLKSFNNEGHGLSLDFNANGIVTGVLSVANNGAGVYVYDGYQSPLVLHHIAAIDNAGSGIELRSTGGSMITHAVAVHNGLDGIRLTAISDGVNFAHVVSTRNGGYGYQQQDTSNTLFAGVLLVEGNMAGGCNVGAGVNPGIDNACASAATLAPATDVRPSFLGLVTTGDPINSSDTGGAAAADAIVDWARFADSYRVWGRDADITDDASRGRCIAGETCRIRDYGLTPADTVLRNAIGTEPILAESPCPTAAAGDVAMTNAAASCSFPKDWTSCDAPYLLNALEILADAIGDDDGLCESDETCIYTPNFGLDQDNGASGAGACTFQNGIVQRVQLYGYQR